MSEEKSTAVQTDKVGIGKTASFGFGPFLYAFVDSTFSTLIFFYYEVELGLATALVGLSFGIYALWNMINDPLIGYLTDKPTRWSKKFGLRTPYILIGSVTLIISYYFMFAVPDFGDVKSNPWPLFWYMIIVTCIFDTCYSLWSTHFIGSFPNIFRSQEARRKGSTFVNMLGVGGALFGRAILIASFVVYGDPSSYVRFALAACLTFVVCTFLFLPGIHENEFIKKRYLQIYEFMQTQKMPYLKFIKTAFKQKNFVVWMVAYTLINMAGVLAGASTLYFVKYILNAEVSDIAIFSLATVLAFIPANFLWSHFYGKKHKHVNQIIIGFLLMATSYFISSMFVTQINQLIFTSIISGIAMGCYVSIIMSISSDTFDEVNNACGRHVEAGIVGIQYFLLRISFLVAGIIIAVTHILTGYVPGAETQTDLALLGIRLHYGLFSTIFCIIGAIILFKYYDLYGDKREQLMASMKKKGLIF